MKKIYLLALVLIYFVCINLSVFAQSDNKLVTSIDLENVKTETIRLKKGEKLYLNIRVSPEDASNKSIICSSENDAVFTVSPYDGVITAQGGGSACLTVAAQDTSGVKNKIKVEVAEFDGPDGPYLFHLPNNKARLISIDENGFVNDEIVAVDENLILSVIFHSKKHRFQVKLHNIKQRSWKHEPSDKIFVLGDPHGNLDCFVNVLQANNVINDKYQWIYGNNHLMIEGDVFDRGNDVLPIFWLIYKLEQEAKEAGGQVSFIYGNHEILVLVNDLRYITTKYRQLANKYSEEMRYADFFGVDTELGRWLSKQNTIEVIGRDMYVHAGFSMLVYDTGLTISQINEELRKGLHKSTSQRNSQSQHSQLLFKTNGPLWYRGLVDRERDNAITDENDLNKIFNLFDVDRIIVGHTIFDDVTTFFKGKVIALNVDNFKNWNNNKGRGILIENGITYIIYGDGRKNKLK